MDSDFGITIARTAGFCPGVKKAIDTVLELSGPGNVRIYTLGPLIHNTQVIKMLEEKNILAVEDVSHIKDKNCILVIRAHGITPELEKTISSLPFKVVDATCPLVKNAQNTAKKYAGLGYSTVIVGDKGHAEVTGLLGYCAGKGIVISGPEEALQLPVMKKVHVLSQTTQEESLFKKTAEIIREASAECVISNTICAPTRERQKETADIAKAVDLMIVAGARHSANTARLVKICSDLGTRTVLAGQEEDLNETEIKKAGKIGITAGASAPAWMIQRIQERVKEIRSSGSRTKKNILYHAWELIINSCVYTAAAAMSLTYACMKLQGCAPDMQLMSLSGFFVLSLHIINRLGEKGKGTTAERKILLGRGNRIRLAAAGISGGIIAITLAGTFGLKIFTLVFTLWLLGVLYPFRNILGLGRILDFPASKDISTALGWGFVCAYAPGLRQGIVFSNANYLALYFAILLVFMRSVMLGISAVHDDLIVGKENLYKLLGHRLTLAVLFTTTALLCAILLMLLDMGWKTPMVKALLTGMCYSLACVLLYAANRFPKGIWAETTVDAQFPIMALLIYASFHI